MGGGHAKESRDGPGVFRTNRNRWREAGCDCGKWQALCGRNSFLSFPHAVSQTGSAEMHFRDITCPDHTGFPGDSDSKQSACSVGDPGSIPGSGRPPGGEHGNPLQDSCLENPMYRGVWRATVYGVRKSWTRLKRLSMFAHRQQCSLNITFMCTGKPETLCDLLYCDVHLIAEVWN